jgi:hypothetical protein
MTLPSNNSAHVTCLIFMLFYMESPPLVFCSRSATAYKYRQAATEHAVGNDADPLGLHPIY